MRFYINLLCTFYSYFQIAMSEFITDDSIDFYGEDFDLGSDTDGTVDNFDPSDFPLTLQSLPALTFQPTTPPFTFQPTAVAFTGQLQTYIPPPRTWVESQPGGVWYKFNEGSMIFVLKTTDPAIIDNQWADLNIRLLYNESMELVEPKIPGVTTFREVSCSIDGDTITLLLKPKEISSTHQGKLFCFSFTIGVETVETVGIDVRTKRTKRNRSTSRKSRPSEPEYKKQARDVIGRLQWSISGYASACEGFVDFTRPIFSCVLCNGHKEHGHVEGCPIIALL
jgi:hypothetical protein